MRLITISPRARKQILAAARWWERYRDKAPDAFDKDVTATLEEIAASPLIGQPVRARRPGVRRVLIERIRYYLYYRVTPRNEIEVMILWHASRRPPRL